MDRVISNLIQDLKLKTTMKIDNLFVGLAEYSTIRVEGVKKMDVVMFNNLYE
jgi:hypothetical protein